MNKRIQEVIFYHALYKITETWTHCSHFNTQFSGMTKINHQSKKKKLFFTPPTYTFILHNKISIIQFYDICTNNYTSIENKEI